MPELLQETVWVVFGYDQYYPPPFGGIEAHTDEDAARAVVDALEEYHGWRNFDGSGGRIDDAMLPERLRDDPPNFEAYGVAPIEFRGTFSGGDQDG